MRIAVFGLGYVGVISAACLAREGHRVIGVDPQDVKVDLVEQGRSPIVEPFVGELLEEAVRAGRLTATTSAAEAVAGSDLSLVCVGTPSLRNGSLDVSALERVCGEIGRALPATRGPHLVVVRSTILPGTMRKRLIPILESCSGLGSRLRVVYHPEFMRESTAVYDYDHPPRTVVGADDVAAAQEVLSLYPNQSGPRIATSVETAELVKYADNAWHALKVSFANEIGNIAQSSGVDSHELMDIFCRDEKLNISPAYLRPGFAFGGSCLPKDVRALTALGRELDLRLPILESILSSNKEQVERAIDHLLSSGARRVAMLGISFKAGTDDLRESPQVTLVERLIGKGVEIRIFDRNVSLARLTGANRAYINHVIPHIAKLLCGSIAEAVDGAELVIIGNAAPEYRQLAGVLGPEQRVYDLVRIHELEELGERYSGVNW